MLRHVGCYLPGVEQNISFLSALRASFSKDPSIVKEISSIEFDRIFKIEIEIDGFLVSAELVFTKIERMGYAFLPNFQTLSVGPSFCTKESVLSVLEQELRILFLDEK